MSEIFKCSFCGVTASSKEDMEIKNLAGCKHNKGSLQFGNGYVIKENPDGSEMLIGGVMFAPESDEVPRVEGFTYAQWKTANPDVDFDTFIFLDSKFIPFRRLVKAKMEMFKK